MHGAPVDIPASAPIGEPPAAFDNQIKHLLAERKKIEAVRAYREAYRCGLKEAKDAIDAIEHQMHMDGYSSLSSARAISNDPFAEDKQRTRSFWFLYLPFCWLHWADWHFSF